MAIRELMGEAVGHILAPVVASISHARHARMFHPEGQTFTGRVDAVDGPFVALGKALEGDVLARFSGALWKSPIEHLEVLGAALRFRQGELTTAAALPDDQDLLFATILSPFTMPFSPITTDAHDYWRNRFWAVSPFDVPAAKAGRVKFRLSPATTAPKSTLGREERLRALVAAQLGILHLEARPTLDVGWSTVARVRLEGVAAIDQAALRFSAFNCGRGIVPRGVVHAMRRATYAASQRARPTTSEHAA